MGFVADATFAGVILVMRWLIFRLSASITCILCFQWTCDRTGAREVGLCFSRQCMAGSEGNAKRVLEIACLKHHLTCVAT